MLIMVWLAILDFDMFIQNKNKQFVMFLEPETDLLVWSIEWSI
jgi:hypothetical protein